MKVFAISDLHLASQVDKPMDIFGNSWDNYWQEIQKDWNARVSDEDIVLICGDISWAMNLEEAKTDIEQIKALKGTKILIRGNHDYWWQSLTKVRNAFGENMIALQNDAVKIGDCIFCGTRGWAVADGKYSENSEDEKIFMREILRLEMALKEAKTMQNNNEKIIVLLHYPPYNSKYASSEFTVLCEKYGASIVVFGHLHGNCPSELKVKINDVDYYLTSCDKLNNKLVEVL